MNDSENEKTYAAFDTATNRKIIADLGKSGAKVFLFPPIETRLIELSEAQNDYFTNLHQFDWLIFADVFGVDYFLEVLEKNAVDLYDLDVLRVCAFGETVSDRLRFAAVHADVIPSKISAPEIVDALANYIGVSEIENLSFLYLTNETESGELPTALREANAAVVELPMYSVKSTENSDLTRLKTLLLNGAIDEFIVTAPEDLSAFGYYFTGENLAEVFAEIKIAVSDGVMLQAAKEYDLRRVGLFHSPVIAKVI